MPPGRRLSFGERTRVPASAGPPNDKRRPGIVPTRSAPYETHPVEKRLTLPLALTWAALVCGAPAAAADVASVPVAAPVLEVPTLHCLGAYWIVRGDDNRNARVAVACRRAGTDAWVEAQPLF